MLRHLKSWFTVTITAYKVSREFAAYSFLLRLVDSKRYRKRLAQPFAALLRFMTARTLAAVFHIPGTTTNDKSPSRTRIRCFGAFAPDIEQSFYGV